MCHRHGCPDESLSGRITQHEQKLTMNPIPAPDLTRRPPRSPRVRLGGYTILPRVLDKARASLVGRLGDYKFNSPLDTLLFGFTGVTAEELLAQVQAGAGDFEVLGWLNAKARKAPHEIAAWSAWTETYSDHGTEGHQWLGEGIAQLDARREDIDTVFAYLDLDDHLSFGGSR